jgi:hypothetical protein
MEPYKPADSKEQSSNDVSTQPSSQLGDQALSNQPVKPATSVPGNMNGSPYPPDSVVPADTQDYHKVPLYRRRWMVVILTFLFVPLGILIVWTGNVYLQNRKTKIVYILTKRQKLAYTAAGVIILIGNILRFSH